MYFKGGYVKVSAEPFDPFTNFPLNSQFMTALDFSGNSVETGQFTWKVSNAIH